MGLGLGPFLSRVGGIMKTAILFPGQGSQSVGMLGEWVDTPARRAWVDAASEAIGVDLYTLIQSGPVEQLNRSEITQPAIVLTSAIIWSHMQEHFPEIVAMAGHSLGEYSALVAAGSLDVVAAVKLVYQRGLAMQAAVPEGTGAMAAILGLSATQVIEACEQVCTQEAWVKPANFNGLDQIVISGHTQGVQNAMEACKALGAKRTILLPVSVPAHSALMQPAQAVFGPALAAQPIAMPKYTIVHNVERTDIHAALLAQLVEPVPFVQMVQTMVASGVTRFVECGPGKVLTGLVRRIAPEVSICSINSPSELKELATS